MENIKRIWPQWEAVEVIGKGGFGTVYKAKKERFGEISWSAIKVVKIPNDEAELKEMTNSGFSQSQIQDYYKKSVQSLISEIRLMEKMKSASHIVGIEDFEVEENPSGIGWSVYIRMELLTNLGDYLNGNRVSVDEVKKMAIHILSALEFCHDQNLIHRDIKPGNIFVSSFGEYKLGDFGISREVEKSNATMSQKGTKSYMAPEMIRMSKYGKNVDLYALGLTMYELLNHGRMPFLPPYPELFYPNDREEAMVKRLTGEEFPDIEGIGDLNAIIKKACHYDPDLRYQNASEMKADLLGVKRAVVVEDLSESNIFIGEELLVSDEKTKNRFSESNFLFEDSVGSLDPVYSATFGEDKAYLTFRDGYYSETTRKVYSTNTRMKSLFESYLSSKDVRYLEEMIQLDPTAQLYILLGDTYRRREREKAYHYYKKAYDLDATDARVLKRYALMAFELNDLKTAFTETRKAIVHVREGKCSCDARILKNLYFIEALIAQKSKDEILAVQCIADIYHSYYKTVSARWTDYQNKFYDLSEIYHEFEEKRFVDDICMVDNMGNLQVVMVAAMKMRIGEQLFTNLCNQNIGSMKKIHPNNYGRILEQYHIDYETICAYYSGLSGKYLFGKYGIYFATKKKLKFIDYYRLPLFYLHPNGVFNLTMILRDERFLEKRSAEPIQISVEVPMAESLVRLRSRFIKERVVPLKKSVEELGLYYPTQKKLKKNNILTVRDLLNQGEKVRKIIDNPHDYLQVLAVVLQL